MCRFKFAFQTVCVLPTVCVRRAAHAAPFRQCAGSNSPFKPLVRFRTSSDGERLSPHPFNILSLLFYFVLAKTAMCPVQIRLSNCLHIADSLCTASGISRTLLTFSVCRKTSIVRYQKWGLGRSPKQGEGGSPTLSPFPGEGVWG